MKPPERFKTADDLDGDELLEVIRAERDGCDEPKFETDEYRRYRADALRSAGLDSEADDSEPTVERRLEEMTSEDHMKAIRSDP